MALRGTLTHWKTRMLAEDLGISMAHALGLLESLWHVTAEDAPAGNVGRLPNRAIVMQMFTDIDPDRLIAAMIKSGHLDEDPTHRLLVHDWDKHADHNTKRKVERRGEKMFSSTSETSSTPRQSGGSDASSHVITCDDQPLTCDDAPLTCHESIPEPEPVPEPEPTTLADSANSQPAGVVFELPLKDGSSYKVPQDLYIEYCKAYPKVNVEDQLNTMRVWLLVAPGRRKTLAGINTFINGWLKRERDGGTHRKRAPRAKNFGATGYAKSFGFAPGENVGLL